MQVDGAGRTPVGMRRYEALIFGTGAVTLSLEVLASRIMTPYFGVSLYIWSGILSITLIFLALGYRLGGMVSQREVRDRVEFLFLAAPVVSAGAIGVACLIYPVLFPKLSDLHLVLGSFIASAVILAVPLVALSAMNPLLISMARAEESAGDGGAGRVFFISTIGSVAGVLLTAFAFIPNLTNYRTMLLLGAVLAAAAVAFSLSAAIAPHARKRLLIAGGAIGALCLAGLWAGPQRILDLLAAGSGGDYVMTVRAEYTSIFGNVKVVEITPPAARGEPVLAYIQDGLIQNRTSLDGKTSLSLYTHVLEKLIQVFQPDARSALVLGLAAGVVPRSLKLKGFDVAVVDINRDALPAARDHFAFEPAGIRLHWQDARSFVRRCRATYDVIVVDLFHGDSTPDYLLTTEFFADVRRCLGPSGAVVMNADFNGADEEPNRRLLATVAANFPRVAVFRDQGVDATGAGYNAFVVGLRAAPRIAREVPLDDVPPALKGAVAKILAAGKRVDRRMLRGVAPMTDDHNIFSILNAEGDMASRRVFAGWLPPHVLLN